jgi:hypothetical protein
MRTYRVTIPAIDEVDVLVEAQTPKRAAIKLLTEQKSSASFDAEEPVEVVVHTETGVKHIYSIVPVLSFQFQKAV